MGIDKKEPGIAERKGAARQIVELDAKESETEESEGQKRGCDIKSGRRDVKGKVDEKDHDKHRRDGKNEREGKALDRAELLFPREKGQGKGKARDKEGQGKTKKYPEKLHCKQFRGWH